MQRHEVIEQLKFLKLHGMVNVFDETVIRGVKQQRTIVEILGCLCLAEAVERKARSIRSLPAFFKDRWSIAVSPDQYTV